MSANEKVYPHYFKELPKKSKEDGGGPITHVDIYVVLRLWGVTCPAIQHSIKKQMCAGIRGAKNTTKDLEEALDSVKRAIELDEMIWPGEEE